MEVAEEKYVSRLQCLLHHELGMIKYRVLLAARADPLPVQILTNNGAAIVTNDNSVRVEHWYDFKYESISKLISLILIAY